MGGCPEGAAHDFSKLYFLKQKCACFLLKKMAYSTKVQSGLSLLVY